MRRYNGGRLHSWQRKDGVRVGKDVYKGIGRVQEWKDLQHVQTVEIVAQRLVVPPPPEFASKSVNPQTIASVKQAKQQEAETAKQMGYNPYAAQMIGLAQARNAAITGGGDTGIGSVSPSPYPVNQSPESQPPQILPETAAAGSTTTD